MKLVFWAQIQRDPGKTDHLMVTKTTKARPSAPEGMVLKFEIEVPDTVFEPEVKASLASLQTITEQTRAEIKAELDKR